MKKTLMALVGAVLLLGLVLFLDHRRDVAHQAEKFAFDTTQKADVNYVKVVLGKDTAILQKINGKWLTASDSFPVDTGKINKGLSYILTLQNKEIVSSNPARLLEYGLDTTQAKHVEWQSAHGAKFQFVLGKTSGTDYGSTYWKWEDKPDVYSTPGNFTWDIPSRSTDWKDHALFTVDGKDVKSIGVDWRDSLDHPVHYLLEAKDSTLVLREPDSAAVKKADATTLLAQCGQFMIDDFVAPGDTNLAHARLDTPMVSIKINLKNGKSYEIHGGRTFNAMVYAQHPYRKEVVKIAPWRFNPFEKRPYELMADSLQAKAAMSRLP